ncbi:transporter [hydrocarbon metagenome]|uniref:Transporter n=1 Tax=hydrocarbon metagenome TaxID=938273 RepID=A0A0W8E544_9ZZZZ
MLGYINAERIKANLAPLVLDEKLCQGAFLKSKDMAVNKYFSHTSPTYGSPFDMMKSLGVTYNLAGENIAKNSSVKGAHDAFMNSSGHRANILNDGFKKVGLGFYQDGYYLFVTQWFTN